MMAPVFGDFLDAASGHVAAAVSVPGDPAGEAKCGTVRELDRVVTTLARYLGDLPLPDDFSPGTTDEMYMRAALDARIAMRRAAQSLHTGAQALRDIPADGSHPVVWHLSAAASHLAAGRDLLQTHFASRGEGSRGPASAWARAMTSRPVTNALLTEIGKLATQLAPWITRISLENPADPGVPAVAGMALHSASRWLWISGATAEAISRQQPPSPEGRLVLGGLPANLPPARRPVTGPEALPDLCEGAVITAERLRQAAVAFTRQGRWSPQATSLSWRRDAQASAVVGHSSEFILRTLAQRAADLDMDPRIQAHLDNAARALKHAWTAWRAVTDEWDLLSTGPDRGKGPSRVAAEVGDLVLRMGRVAYRNPGWTPAFGGTSRTRDPADLAPAPADLRTVVAAVHHSTDALRQIAIQDRHCARRALTEGRLYIARRLLPADYDIPYRQVPAPRSRARPLLVGYDLTVKTCTAATTALDGLALAAEAPTRVLAAAHRLSLFGQQPQSLPQDQWIPAQLAAPIQPSRIEYTLRDLQISDPDLLLRAATIDEATRALATEVTTKRRRAETIADATARRSSTAQYRPSRRSPRAGT
jgi:hypothetical protein